ncbi:hypothetical protein BCR32DRAFT_284844 [Anaeromyces robustus]|uniref:SAPS-domain-containing protein n=1 Tax=Anaeromyces robustus TaxID=1754192 RepID=A0A1Y1WQY1_9FUNG|nr:hypothetical protein BCR32DRAFT_284844 [Anaeromyces robustus]|eukprot:ORX75795.1 hypothetical protein BCR32DRAFT_284844 [Anaeromyces robustus]
MDSIERTIITEKSIEVITKENDEETKIKNGNITEKEQDKKEEDEEEINPFDYDDDVIVHEDVDDEVIVHEDVDDEVIVYDDDVIVHEDVDDEVIVYDDDVIVHDDVDDDVIVHDDVDDDVIVNDDIIVNDSPIVKDNDPIVSPSFSLSFSSALNSFRNARVQYNTIDPKKEGFDPNDIKGTAPKMFEKLLDMDNPSINKELFQILVDYDECLKMFLNYLARVPEYIPKENKSELEKDDEKISLLKEIEQNHNHYDKNKNTHSEDIKNSKNKKSDTEIKEKGREVKNDTLSNDNDKNKNQKNNPNKINNENKNNDDDDDSNSDKSDENDEDDDDDENEQHSPYEKYNSKNLFNVLEKDDGIQLDTIDNIEDYDIELIDENDLFLLPSYLTIDEDVYRVREREDITVMKRSYNVMEILCSRTEFADKLMKEKSFIIGDSLLNVFLPKSDGNMNHFKKAWEFLIALNGSSFADLLVSPDYLSHAFFDMLKYIHESPVMTALIKTIFSDYYSSDAQIKIYDHLNELDFLESVLGLLDLEKPRPETISAVSELFDNIIEQSSRHENSNILFKAVQSNPSCIINLIDNIAEKQNYSGEVQRNASIEILYSIVTKSIYTPVPSMFDDTPPPPPIYPLQQFRFSVFIYLREFVWDLCLGMQYSLSNTEKQTTGQKYVASKPFGVARLQLFEIIYETLKKFPRSLPKVLENIPWKMLVNWFFEYKFNTRYQDLFYKVFDLVIKSNHTPTIKKLITKTHLITRLLDHYNSKEPTDCRGYIILMCNNLRFHADTHPNGYVHVTLQSHPKWNEFLPELRRVTEMQNNFSKSFDILGCPRPLPYTPQPLNFEPIMDILNSGKFSNKLGTELGSVYAALLGYGPAEKKDVHPNSHSKTFLKKNSKKSKRKTKKIINRRTRKKEASDDVNTLNQVENDSRRQVLSEEDYSEDNDD